MQNYGEASWNFQNELKEVDPSFVIEDDDLFKEGKIAMH